MRQKQNGWMLSKISNAEFLSSLFIKEYVHKYNTYKMKMVFSDTESKKSITLFLLVVMQFCFASNVISQNKIGYIDKTGTLVIPAIFEHAGGFGDGLAYAQVGVGDKYGYIDKTGNFVIPPVYAGAGNFKNGFAPVLGKNIKWGFIDKKGTIVVEPFAEMLGSFENGLATYRVKLDNGDYKYGYIDTMGSRLTPPVYSDAFDFSDGLARVEKNNLSGYINNKGEEVIALNNVIATRFREGLAIIKRNGQSFIIDTKGKTNEIINIDWAYPFQEGLAAVKVNGLWGYINIKGTLVIPAQYGEANDFKYGVSIVEMDKVYILINKKNETVATIKALNKVYDFIDGAALIISTDSKWGYVDTLGKIIIAEKFEFAGDFKERLACVSVKSTQTDVKPTPTTTQTDVKPTPKPRTTSNGIQVSVYDLDIFHELGCMGLYVGSTMYVVPINAKDLGDIATAAARAAVSAGITGNYKYQWFPNTNCNALKNKYSSAFTVQCKNTLKLN